MHESPGWVLVEDLDRNAARNRMRDLKASHAALQPGTIDELCMSLWSLGRTDDPIGVLNQVLGFMAWTQIEDHLHLIARKTATAMSLYNKTSDTYLADARVIEDTRHDGSCDLKKVTGMPEENYSLQNLGGMSRGYERSNKVICSGTNARCIRSHSEMEYN